MTDDKPHTKAIFDYAQSMLDAAVAAEATQERLPIELRQVSQESVTRLRTSARELEAAAENLTTAMNAAVAEAQRFARVQMKIIERPS
jgi:hypothetical protein